ncbi:MAG: hypothetical protein WBM53_05935, partial [Maribacter sp.]
MTSLRKHLQRSNYTLLLVLITFYTTGLQSCKSDKKQPNIEQIETKNENVVEILTKDMEFQMSDTISSGWNIFRYKNLSPQTHFFLIEKYPEGKTLEDAKNHVIPYFSSGMKLINEGENEKAMAEFGKLPEWYGDVKFLGGSGLISAGKTAETMVRLEPGYYLAECYVKMSNGEFHSAMGMIDEFVVSNIASNNEELKADSHIDISSEKGITFKDTISSG